MTPITSLYGHSNIDYLVGCDLGKKNDNATFVVVERETDRLSYNLDVRQAWMVPVGTPYPYVIELASKLAHHPLLVGKCIFAIDKTGVGEPVLDQMRVDPFMAEICWGIGFTNGRVTNRKGMDFTVPKNDLVASAQVAMQTGILRFHPQIRDAVDMKEQLLGYTIKRNLSTGHAAFGGEFGESFTKDDLVSGLLCAVWLASQIPQDSLGYQSSAGGSNQGPWKVSEGSTAMGRHASGSVLPSWRKD